MALKKSELYSSLWASCDELRGGMDASQYKDYVLVLLFVKYVSDKFAGQPYAPITIPAGAGFADMVALKGKTDIGDQINKKILGPLARENNLSDMPDFNDRNNPNRSLYDDNKAVYSFLRYGVPVKIEAGKVTETVKVINWAQPEKNDFVIVEEVTLLGNHERRPDLVLYVNGIAVAVIELKNSYVYFCGNTEIADALKAHEPQRVALYKGAAALVRAYANIGDDLPQAGYTDARIAQIKQDLTRYLKLREIIRQASGETIDLKAYEADMRHLIDTYIEAGEPREISDFGEIGLLELIVKSGMADAISSLPSGIKSNQAAVAETIANNVRSKIIKEHLNDPAFYDKMSVLLKEILDDLRTQRISYEEFLKRIAEVAKQVQAGKGDDTPEQLSTPGKRALYNNLKNSSQEQKLGSHLEEAGGYKVSGDPVLKMALRIDETVRRVRPDKWRGVKAKENIIKGALLPLLGEDQAEVERLFLIIYAQREY